MFEDFRNQADESSFPDQDPELDDLRNGLSIDRPQQHLFGMTSVQRFAISVLLLLMTCVLGALFLLVTESVILPFFS